MDNLLFIDFESYFSTELEYDLKNISVVEYVRDPRFKAFGMGFALEGASPIWVSAANIAGTLKYVPWNKTSVVGHNVKFDGFILKEIYGVTPKSYIDTKGMSRAVLGKSVKNHSLKTLAEHFGLKDKGVMKTDGLTSLTEEQEKELAEYCLHDVELCRSIYNLLAPSFPDNQYPIMDQTIKMFVHPKLQLNVPLLEKTAKEEATRREELIKKTGFEKAIFSSNKKFPELLVSKGYEVPTKTSPRTGKTIPAIALGDPEFLNLLGSENEELKMLCQARIAAKSTLLETRSTKLGIIGASGRWPFDVEFSGADQTHRFSGGSGAGGNPQNFTRDSSLREAVEAPQGYSLVIGDFSNIEFRIVAYLSKDPGLIHAIETGLDIYCDFASAFFGRKITKSDKKERQFGKTAILGLGYNMGAEKFQKTVRTQTGETISDIDARKAVQLYRRRYIKVPALWQTLDKKIGILLREGFTICNSQEPEPMCITLPSGLKMRYHNLRTIIGKTGKAAWVYDAYSKGMLETRNLYGGKVLEGISQGLAGEICKESMQKMGDQVVGQAHDELILVCKKGLETVMAIKLKKAMTTSPIWFPEIKLNAEVHSGPNWRVAK